MIMNPICMMIKLMCEIYLHKTVLYHIASSDFEIPYSRIGKLFEGTRLQKLFNYRKEATIRALESKMKHGLFIV